MSSFAGRVAALTGLAEDRLERLAGGDLSQVLLLRRPDGRLSVAKGGPAVGTEAAMLRSIAGAGVPVPSIEGEHDHVLLLEYVAHDGIFSPAARCGCQRLTEFFLSLQALRRLATVRSLALSRLEC